MTLVVRWSGCPVRSGPCADLVDRIHDLERELAEARKEIGDLRARLDDVMEANGLWSGR